MASARSSRVATSRPMIAPGTSPKKESAEQHGAGEAGVAHVVTQGVQAGQGVAHRVDDRQPAEAIGDLVLLGGGRLPEGRVVLPDALGEALAVGTVERGVYRALQAAKAG